MSKRYPRSIPAPRSVFQGRNSFQSARKLLVAIQATHIATLAMNGQCGHFYDATGLSHGIMPLMAQLASLYSQLTNSKAGASSHVSSASARLRTSLNRLLDVPTSEVPSSTRMDRDLHAPIPQKAISSPSKFYIFSTLSRRAGTLDFKSQGGVQPSYTSTHLNHHLSSFYKLPTCRFPCAFASQAFSWPISYPTRMVLYIPYSYQFLLYSTEETIKEFAFLKICHPNQSPATYFISSHAPCTRTSLYHLGHPYHSIRSQITLQDVSYGPRNLLTGQCLTSVSYQWSGFGRTIQAWGSAIES
jgi:hypothetical protein